MCLLSCNEKPVLIEYFSTGAISSITHNINNESYIRSFHKNGNIENVLCELSGMDTVFLYSYYENGILKNKSSMLNNIVDGYSLGYYETGQPYSFRKISHGKENGRTDYFYKNGDVKAVNMFKNDTLYYLESIDFVTKKSTKVITPIINFSKNSLNDSIVMKIEIPFENGFPLYNDNLNLYYCIKDELDTSKVDIPDTYSIFNKSRTSITVNTSLNDKDKTLIGLISINEETITHLSNYFEEKIKI